MQFRQHYTYSDFTQSLFHTSTLKFRNRVLQTDLSHLWQRHVIFLSSHSGAKTCNCLVDLFIKRALGCPVAGFALHIASILLNFLSQVFRLSPKIFKNILKKFCFLLHLVPRADSFCVMSMLEDKELLMHQLSVVRFLFEGEGGEVILSTTPSEVHLNMHGSSRLFFHWQQQAYCCYHCDRHCLQIIFLLAEIPLEIFLPAFFFCLVRRSMCQSP